MYNAVSNMTYGVPQTVLLYVSRRSNGNVRLMTHPSVIDAVSRYSFFCDKCKSHEVHDFSEKDQYPNLVLIEKFCNQHKHEELDEQIIVTVNVPQIPEPKGRLFRG